MVFNIMDRVNKIYILDLKDENEEKENFVDAQSEPIIIPAASSSSAVLASYEPEAVAEVEGEPPLVYTNESVGLEMLTADDF